MCICLNQNSEKLSGKLSNLASKVNFNARFYIRQKVVFQNDLRKRSFFRNIDIFGDMGKKRFFKVISKKHTFNKMLIFSGIGERNDF